MDVRFLGVAGQSIVITYYLHQRPYMQLVVSAFVLLLAIKKTPQIAHALALLWTLPL